MNLKPVGDKILIEPIRSKVQQSGSIITPGDWQPRPSIGLVVGLGEDAKRETNLKPGDRVLLNQMAGTSILDGRFSIYRACEILCVT